MDINGIIEEIRKHPNSEKIGMIASHLGIVRGNSRDGREVTRIQVSYDKNALNNIVLDIKELDGIVEVKVEICEGLLEIGDVIMFVAIGGDIRENVFPALIQTVERIKKESSKKMEYFE
ncbi:molybdenum cofactor biosynthesis protein MoaE [Thermodesulfobacteriota bacterium]